MDHSHHDFDGKIPTATSVREIAALPEGTEALYVPRLDDASAEAVSHLQRLRVLFQGGSPSGLTDKGLEALARLPMLETLDLEWAAGITDSGLAALHRITSLRWLDLGGCSGISESAVEELRRILPSIEIER